MKDYTIFCTPCHFVTLSMKMTYPFSFVVAMTKTSRGIGAKNTLPWNFKEDLAFFKKVTTSQAGVRNVESSNAAGVCNAVITNAVSNATVSNAVIMGRNTWESLPPKRRPLPNRANYIISRTLVAKHEPNCFPNLNDALHVCYACNQYPYVIGGQQLFESSIGNPNCEKLYVTEINDSAQPIECDTFFPQIPPNFFLTSSKPGTISPELTFKEYQNWSEHFDPKSDEQVYLGLLRDILENGEQHSDRTGTGIKSVFGRQMRFRISDGILPLMTTKKLFFKGVVEELLFFLRGDHDNRKLQARGVHIWDGNTSREYLDQYNKQHIDTYDLGLAYGVQWRAAGAPLGNIDTDYRGLGIDQVQEVINLLREDPNSRRIIINAWNVPQLKDMALPPCHCFYQFYVSAKTQELSCMMFQRSVDVFLGNPFNVASTALLTHIIAKTVGLKTGEIVISMGNTHIYNNHIDQVKRQLERTPLKFPRIEITKELNTIQDIEQLKFEDFSLIDYRSWPGIKAQMAV